MALMLQVPWSQAHLPVGYEEVTDEISQYVGVSPNVEVIAGGDVLVKDFFGVNNRVPDVSRYHIDENRQPVCHCDIPESQLQPQLRTIVLLVESPHRDEYRCGNYFPIAPANGTTGRKINDYLCNVLLDVQEEITCVGLNAEEYIDPGSHVIISNPIQFQTSLNAIHEQSLRGEWKELKDNVWIALWNEGEGGEEIPGYIQLCFRARLNTYRPSLIINACTGDRTEDDSLTAHVETFVLNEFQDVPLIDIGHPSFWQVPANRNPTLINPQPNHNADNT